MPPSSILNYLSHHLYDVSGNDPVYFQSFFIAFTRLIHRFLDCVHIFSSLMSSLFSSIFSIRVLPSVNPYRINIMHDYLNFHSLYITNVLYR